MQQMRICQLAQNSTVGPVYKMMTENFSSVLGVYPLRKAKEALLFHLTKPVVGYSNSE
jgi:hypothetical protein